MRRVSGVGNEWMVLGQMQNLKAVLVVVLAPLIALAAMAAAAVLTDDPWCDVPEAVEYLRTSRKSLYRRVAQRQIRYTKDGGQLRFRRSWLDDYLRQHEQAPVELVRPKVVA